MGKSLWEDFLGCEVKVVRGPRYGSRVAEAGAGHPETLLMTHPGGGHVETFARNIGPLGERLHAVGVEMLWHGFSDKPPMDDDRIAQEAGQVLDVMDALGVERAWVHGNASGAVMVTWLALHRPERLKGIIYQATAGGVKLETGAPALPLTPPGGMTIREQSLAVLANPTWEAVRDRLLHTVHPDHHERITDELVDVRLALYRRPDTNESMTRYYSHNAPFSVTEEEIAQVALPTLVLAQDTGEQALAAGQRLAAVIPGAEFKLLEGTGLWGHWETPDVFNQTVLRFIDEHAA